MNTLRIHLASLLLVLTEATYRLYQVIESASSGVSQWCHHLFLKGTPGYILFAEEDAMEEPIDGYVHYRLRTDQGIKTNKIAFQIANRYLIRKYGFTPYLSQQVRSAALMEGFEVMWVVAAKQQDMAQRQMAMKLETHNINEN